MEAIYVCCIPTSDKCIRDTTLYNSKNALFLPYSLNLGLLSFLQDVYNDDKNFTQLLKVLQLNSPDEMKNIVKYEKHFHSVLLNGTNNCDSQIKMCNKVLASRYYSPDCFLNNNNLKDIKEICFQTEYTPSLEPQLASQRVDTWLTKVFAEDVKCLDSGNIFTNPKNVLINANFIKVL